MVLSQQIWFAKHISKLALAHLVACRFSSESHCRILLLCACNHSFDFKFAFHFLSHREMGITHFLSPSSINWTSWEYYICASISALCEGSDVWNVTIQNSVVLFLLKIDICNWTLEKEKNQCQAYGIGTYIETKRKWMSHRIWIDDRFAMIFFFPLGDYVSQEVTNT